MMFDRRKRRGFSLIELLIVIAIILIIITIAAPKLNRARMYAQETAAMGAIRTLHTAQVQYSSQYGRFATSLTELGPPASGGASAASADLIGSDLAAGEKGGYRYSMTGNPSGYIINANPVAYNATGSKTYYSDQTMVVRENNGPEPATAQSREVGDNRK
jgi:prepilin-type N-terminal cleavage/methylation domain-containing protein